MEGKRGGGEERAAEEALPVLVCPGLGRVASVAEALKFVDVRHGEC